MTTRVRQKSEGGVSMAAKINPNPAARVFTVLGRVFSAMADRMARQVATAVDDNAAAQQQACPIRTAVEFGLHVPRKGANGNKRIFY
jgi:hypothetical protein